MADSLYDDLVGRYSDNFVRVRVPEDKVEKINALVDSIVEQKQKENIHQIDGNKERKRFFNGLLGEAAIEKLLGIDIIDWSVGDSKNYNYPDVKIFGVGIKTVEKGKFPVIPKRNDYSQIICIVSDTIKNLVFVCGLATVDVLNDKQSDTLLWDKQLASRGVKTGFYGFDKLKKVLCIDDLK